MIKIFALCLLAVSAYGAATYGYRPHGYGYGYAPTVKVVKVEKVEKVEKPQPYEFAYDITDDYHNTRSRQESGDAHGNKQGSYSMKNAEGLERTVTYVADENGFRATVKTNEPGTDDQDPADVDLHASPVEVKEVPKKVIKKILIAPSYGHHGYVPVQRHHGYHAPSYEHHAFVHAPAHGYHH